MEDNGQNTLIAMAGSLALVVLVLSIAFGLYKLGSRFIQNSTNDVTTMMTEADEAKFTIYEHTSVKGSQVLSLLGQWSQQPVCITVVNAAGSTQTFNYTSKDLSTKVDMKTRSKDYLDATKPDYINPAADFYVTIERSEANNSIINVIFDQRGAGSTS